MFQEKCKKIPYSTIKSWESQSEKQIVGQELEKDFSKISGELKLLYNPNLVLHRKYLVCYLKFIRLMYEIFDKKIVHKAFENNKDALMNFTSNLEKIIPQKKIANMLGIGLNKFYSWKYEVKNKCSASGLGKCFLRHPNQASASEVSTMEKCLKDEKYIHWGLHSIWAFAFKNKLTRLSKSTWYRYNKICKFRLKSNKGQKPIKPFSVRASTPNEIWHADITVFKILDGIRYYIYTVMDNFSRYIISWKIEKYVSSAFRLQTLKDSMESAFVEVKLKNLHLITDGGPENDNKLIKNWINELQVNFKHSIALRDVTYSNSMMEAF